MVEVGQAGVPEGGAKQTYAGSSSAERTLDPYINLDLIQNFVEIVLPSS